MKTKIYMLICTLFLLSAALFAQDTGNENNIPNAKNQSGEQPDMNKDMEFVREAASGGMMEVKLGKLAKEKGSSQDVKDFGAMMVKDHSKANEELKAVAKKNNISVPSDLMEEHQEHVDELSRLSGSEFDEAYVDLMMEDHEEDISKFEDAAENLTNSDLKNFASKTLPVLKEHHQKITEISKRMDTMSRGNDTEGQ